MHRRLVLGAAVAFSAVFGHGAVADSKSDTTVSPNLASTPVKLDRRHAQLRLVQVVFRHGARTPLTDAAYLWEGQEWNVGGSAYEAVPLQLMDVNGGPAPVNEHDQKQMSTVLAGGASKGQLSRVGQLQALELGYWLRQQYIDTHGFMPASYKPGVVSSRTTNFSRTRATLAGVLTGLYPGVTESVPVTTSGDLDEILYADTKRCAHLKVLMTASEAMLKAAWDGPARSPTVTSLQQQLSELLKLPEGAWQRRWMMTDIHDALTSLAAHGKELPAGLTQDMRDAVDALATEEISAFICPALVDSHGHAVLRLSMGRLLDVLLDNMKQAVTQHAQHGPGSSGTGSSNGSSSSASGQQQHVHPKLMLYSGHDSTIMPLLTALGVDLQRWPPYISNMAFELWELTPPTLNPKSNMALSSSASSSASSSPSQQGSSAAAAAAGPFVVRVLYNKQPLKLPGASQANPTLLELGTFSEQVLAPFILSQEQHEQACSMTISHDSALPHPDTEGMELSLSSAPGGSVAAAAGQQQQQQQTKQQQQKSSL